MDRGGETDRGETDCLGEGEDVDDERGEAGGEWAEWIGVESERLRGERKRDGGDLEGLEMVEEGGREKGGDVGGEGEGKGEAEELEGGEEGEGGQEGGIRIQIDILPSEAPDQIFPLEEGRVEEVERGVSLDCEFLFLEIPRRAVIRFRS